MWDKIFNRDNLYFGALLGLLLPMVSYAILYLADLWAYSVFGSHIVAKVDYLYLLSITINLFPMRFYFVNVKYDKTGRGVLLITLIQTLSFFLVTGIN